MHDNPSSTLKRSPVALALSILAFVLIVVCDVAPLLAQSGTEWDASRYADLVASADRRLAEAEAEHDPGRRRELFVESIHLKEDAVRLLREGLASGVLDDDADLARGDLFNLLQNLIALRLRLDMCDDAQIRLEFALTDRNLLDDPAVEALEALREPIQQCRQRTGQAPRVAAAESGPGDESEEASDEDAPAVLPLGLLGAGVVILGVSFGYDLSLAGERDTFEAVRGACDRGCTQETYARGRELRDELNRAKVITGVLYAVGLSAAVTGAVLYFTTDHGESLSVAPEVGPGRVGAGVSVRF